MTCRMTWVDDLDDLKPYKRRRDSVVEVSCADADQRAVETFAEERSLKLEAIEEREVRCANSSRILVKSNTD